MNIELDIIREACDIIEHNPTRPDVFREQANIIRKELRELKVIVEEQGRPP